jgi:hypothetical protein
MKKLIALLLALLMMLSAAFVMTSCKKKDNTEKQETEVTEEEVEIEEEAKEDMAEVVKTFAPDSEEELGHDLPLEIESITLYKDGSVRIVPTGDLKKNELGDSDADSIMPFAESGPIKDLYVYRIGNGGYRVILGVTEEGTVSAVNALALLEDHIAVVMDNLGGRDSFTGIEQESNEDGFSIIGKTEEGDDVVLDPVLLSNEARGSAEEDEEEEEE